MTCIDHNGKRPAGRRAVAHSVQSDDDFDMRKRVRPNKQGIPKNVVKVHGQAVAAAAKRRAIHEHVSSSLQMLPFEKARAFVSSITSASKPNPTVQRKQTKEEADGILSASGWRRCSTREAEGLHLNDNLEHDEYEVLFCARDGHCLFHCFVAILAQHGKPKEDVSSLRNSMAEFFTKKENNVMCAVTGMAEEISFQCESIKKLRSNMYGGISEIVAFGVMYDLAVTVFAPENQNNPITYNPGNIDAEFPEEILLNTLGWKDDIRNAGSDHWQRVKKREFIAPSPELVAAPSPQLVAAPSPQLVAASDADERKARRAAFKRQAQADKEALEEEQKAKAADFIRGGGSFNFDEPGGNVPQPKTVPTIAELHSQLDNLKQLEQSAMRSASVIEIASGSDDERDGDGKEEDEDGGKGTASSGGNLDADEEEDEDGREGTASSEGGDYAAQDMDGEDAEADVRRDGSTSPQPRGNPRGRKASKTDTDDVTWTQETLLTFLNTIVAHNPFEKCFSTRKKIGEKWDEIAADMAKATKNLGVHAVVSTGDALRVKYAREKLRCKNYREGGKSQRQSGLGGAKDKNLAELADHMDACLNLQKDAEHHKDAKKNAAKAKQNYRQGVVEPAVIDMAAGNIKMQKRMLKLLHKEDQELRKQQAYHEENKVPWQPSPLQLQNMQMWQEAKTKYPDAAKQAETEPNRRCRLSDQIAASMKLQEEWIKSQTGDPSLEAALLDAVRSLTSAPMQVQGATQGGVPSSNKASRLQELKELLDADLISHEEYADARTSILRS